ITIATNMAGRGTDIQLGGNLEMRIEKELANIPEGEERNAKITALKEDISQLKAKAIAAGGLYVLATERHESRRIDNQLRGRSGRQGDPGKSKFFLSLEDDLMRIFGSERMHGMLQKLGLKEGEAITHPWINKALEKAQTKVEARNFEIRKNLLKYDDVMNDQRKVIFEQRLEILQSEHLTDVIEEMREDVMHSITAKYITADNYPEQWDIENLAKELKEAFNLTLPFAEWQKEDGINAKEIAHRIDKAAQASLTQKEQHAGPEIVRYFEKTVLIETIDTLWRQHLENLEHLRSVVGFRGYAQRDPLNEYKTEAFGLFQQLLSQLRYDAISKLLRIDIAKPTTPIIDLSQLRAQHAELGEELGLLESNITTLEIGGVTPQARIPKDDTNWGRVGRNSPCPCGSGKKYKHCHGSFA
ncbi:MAG: SEC-C metal-binding domain-containing protein, partial [Alphaproteobacteria bacterium]|nr:SEC-C metal-binding domain-containing protein [Alphaproteobacteria bacterium]